MWAACDPGVTSEAITGAFPIAIEDDGWLTIAGYPLFPSILYMQKAYSDPCEQLFALRSIGPHDRQPQCAMRQPRSAQSVRQ